MDMVQTTAHSAGLAWASGLRLYLVVFLPLAQPPDPAFMTPFGVRTFPFFS